MANTISSDLTTALKNLAPTFQTAINASIEAESDPLKRVQAQKDLISVRRGIYSDIKTNMSALQSAIQGLISTQTSYNLNSVLKTSIIPGTAGSSVITATNSSSATAADYDISVTHLARAQARATVAAASPDLALGKSGTFWLGGTGASAINNFTPDTTVTASYTGLVADGQIELGAGNYSVQVRDYSGARQFRLVNADGTAVSIHSTESSGYTSGWQSLSDGNYDTGRGMTFSLSTSGATGCTALTYAARGMSISISATDSQRNIVNAINSTTQPEGRAFKASIVGGQIVLTGTQTGANHSMVYTDNAGLGFGAYVQNVFTVGADLQAAQNAEFNINGMSVARAANANLMDVIDGITINLSGDAEGKTARLTVAGNNDKSISSMNDLVTKFNAAFSHITQKMATTSKTVGDKTTYTRGPLNGDTIFRSLRADMVAQINRNVTNSGNFKNLADIGLSFDKDLKLTLDSAKFSEAIKSQPSDVTALLDAAMGQFNTTLSHHTGTAGSLQNTLTAMDVQLKSFDQRINKYNDALNSRKQSLINQYLQMQNQLADLGREAQMFGITLGTNVNTSS